MDYITVRQAAGKWNVSMRQVQLYLKDNRVAGALRPGHDWLIPDNADKPEVSRRKKQSPPQKSLSSDLAEVIAEASLPLPCYNPDAILDTVSAERLRLQYKAELAYLRGDFELTKRCYQKTEGDDVSKLRASSVAIASAISTGDYILYKEIETYLKSIIETNIDALMTTTAELSLDTAYVSAFAPNMVSNLLKNGDFSVLPIQLRPTAAFFRAKYYMCLGKFERALDIAQTALNFCDTERGISIRDIYLRIECAKACCGLNFTDRARRYLSDAVNIYLPHGFITPFVEAMTSLGGLLEQCLEREFQVYYDDIMRQWDYVSLNWVMFHNQFTKNNITTILTPRETEIALLAARRVPYKEISAQFNISPGRVKAIIHEIYGKLFVNNRNELSQYIL